MRKQQKAEAAEQAMMTLAINCDDRDRAHAMSYWAGRFGAMSTYHGFLSTSQITTEVLEAGLFFPDFVTEYEKEMAK